MTRLAPLEAWQNFYLIVGSAAAALTGVQFVVIALVADISRRSKSSDSVHAFGTPTVVHFCVVLLISAVIASPWPALSTATLAFSICGAAGIVYVFIVLRRARHQTRYAPVLEDWVWHTVLPLVAYAALLVASLAVPPDGGSRLFVIAAASLLLLFIGIHNAWDSATYMVLERSKEESEKEGTRESSG
jgi:hypothetical protein